MRVAEDQQFATIDGRIVRGSALDLDGDIVATNRRMVFVGGTEPEEKAKTMQKATSCTYLEFRAPIWPWCLGGRDTQRTAPRRLAGTCLTRSL